ncbi:MAG TPA: alpha/beta hydrolase, partial [Gemmatimonadota bacterium]|nr:alpha/beta hydrolase [Gemmatimonadota bacterium]
IADTATDPRALCEALYHAYLKNYFFSAEAMRKTIRNGCADPAYNLKRAFRAGSLTSSDFGEWQWDTLMREIQAPVLVIHGRQDFAPVAGSEAWSRAYPNSRILIIENSGHFPFMEQPTEFFSAVEEFLGGRWPAKATKTAR